MTGRLLLPVVSFEPVTPWSRQLTLDLGTRSFAFDAGQAVYLGRADQSVRKPYSIACAPGDAAADRRLEFLIAADPNAPPEPHLADLSAATPVEVSGPVGRFVLPAPLPGSALFVAGGTGIAPLRAMLRHLLAASPEAHAGVVHAARTAADFAYADELRRLANTGRIRLSVSASREPRDSGWTGQRGRLTADDLRPHLGGVPVPPVCFVCGPPGFVTHVTALLGSLGVPPDRIRREEW